MKTKGTTLVFNNTKIWKYQSMCQLMLLSWHNVICCLFLKHRKFKYTPKKIHWSAQTSG